MRRFDPISAIILGLSLGLAIVLQTASASENVPESVNSLGESAVPGPLDGLTFRGALGPDGQPKDTPDIFVFENGSFVSKECELRCKYPARPYYVRVNGSKTDFISETRCPYKDATIVWRGTVEGDRITGKSTWTVKRWYWTIEDTFEFEGKLVGKNLDAAIAE